MTQADPWDEASRLQKQMEAELLAELKDSRRRLSKPGEGPEKAPAETPDPRAPETH
jgi:hypothetical protein